VNVPNWITVGRIALVPVFLLLAYRHSNAAAMGAFIIWVVAAGSDKLDGYLARRNGTITRLGQFLDPTADKLLVGAALFALVDTRDFPLWAALAIAAREVAVQVLRTSLLTSGRDLPASSIAKAKTGFQLLLVGWWLLPWDEIGAIHWALLGAALITAYWSGAEYFIRARKPLEVIAE